MISIGTTFNYTIPLRKQLPLIKNAGFTHVSIGARIEHSNYLEDKGKNDIRTMVESHGLGICSIHTPFGKGIDISSPDNAISDRTVELYQRCIDTAWYLSAGVVIFHPTAYLRSDNIDARKDVVARNVAKLLDHAGKGSVRLAVENDSYEPANDVLSHLLDEISDPGFGFCYDSSHDNLVKQPLALLDKYGRRLLTTHISDNRGKEDDHMLPFEGSYDWDRFCKVFPCDAFGGIFLLEVEMRESAYKTPAEFLSEAFRRGEKLRKACRM
ncbi:MAG: sugar phosphate isomerase/epimerase [candidate division WOR-3 bacterium]|nr:MAG: sugar phosphate isomerase/epimerase [candidate division WOR-3 bacterium]